MNKLIIKTGIIGNPNQGPFVKSIIKLNNSIVIDIKFDTHKCGVLRFICVELAELVKNKTIQDILAISQQQAEKHVGYLPLGKRHYPKMVIDAIQNPFA